MINRLYCIFFSPCYNIFNQAIQKDSIYQWRKIMKTILTWIKKHIVATWAIISVIFVISVHTAFSVEAPVAWLIAKWSPGDILAYVGTVSLGLLAVWQNNRFKEENDVAQQRLERLTVQANELTTINKIIEIESARLERLRKTFDDFSTACDPQTLTTVYADTIDSPHIALAIASTMVATEKKIDDSFFALSRELRSDTNLQVNDNDPLKISLRKYYYAAKKYVDKVKNSPTKNFSPLVTILSKERNEFISQRERYLISKERKLNKVIYGNLSLEEIKSLYCNEQ